MTTDEPDYFLFIGDVDSESATTKLRSSGATYLKKLLSSKPENWARIVTMITSPHCRGVLVVLRRNDYEAMCRPEYEEESKALLDALAGRSHVVLVHEAVFLTDKQRAANDVPADERARENVVPVGLSDEDRALFESVREEWEDPFRAISDATRERVNAMLRDRQLNVFPYRTNVERSIIASGFLEDNERHLLFRFYVPSGRLYAQEAEALLGLFREWLGQTGHSRVRQEGYSTAAGQVFEFFSGDGQPEGGLSRYFEDFSSFLGDCVAMPAAAVAQLIANGVAEDAATIIVSRYATRARRLSLDLKQRREERMLSLKHELENIVLEVDGLTSRNVEAVLDEMLPPPAAIGVIEGPRMNPSPSLTVNNFNPQFIKEVTGSVVQNIAGTVNLGVEAKQLLELIATFGGHERAQLETAVHELEDGGARGADRVAARGRLKRFLADLGNRGLGVGLNVLQKYVEHKIGVS
ncbi:hypothetical protein [Pseudarthrobacter sp. WHRI 8279]|jgi:hypothetical protein|uniref:hypothetical protein n=1 Tax=Pseudarthrobacter sp. WHRI 8279 TaxID=3162566 RepID=UPI0032EEE376